MAVAKKVVIDVISDFYGGFIPGDTYTPHPHVRFASRLDAAIATFRKSNEGNFDFLVRWHPFFLDPTLPRYGKDKEQHYNEKFGEEMLKRNRPHLAAAGKQVGINFSFGGMISNTMDAHRLLEFAVGKIGDDANSLSEDKLIARQNIVAESLYKAYFEQEKNLGDEDVLLSCAAEGGLDQERIQRMIHSDEGVDHVRAQAEAMRMKYGVRGVPLFVVGGKYKVSGAQDSEVFVEMFEELLA